MKRQRLRRGRMLLVPLGLLAALILAFAYAPGSLARHAAPAARHGGVARSRAARDLAPHRVAHRATTPTVVTFTLRSAAPAAVAAGLPDLDQSAPAHGRAPSRHDIVSSTLAARAFLAGYLPYSYGDLPARRIPDVTGALRQTLARQPATITPGEHGLHPRLLTLGVSGGRTGQVALLGVASDGREAYAVAVTVTRSRGGRWLVSAVW